VRTAALALGLLAAAPACRAEGPAPGAQCHYSYSVWNTKARRSLTRRSVAKPASELRADEKGPLGCTPCEEDQVEVILSNGLAFKACRQASASLKEALDAALTAGQRIETVLGYRAQMSKGPADKAGNRTQLSNHAFGAAVDLNEAHNGLYSSCVSWSKSCKRIMGGRWDPRDPLSLGETSPAVIELGKVGFLWGGRIEGRQKDFMHFSPTGY